jgi:hypothetical protein
MAVHSQPHFSSDPTATGEHTRVTTFALDPLEPDVEAAVRRIGETAVAALSREPGFDGAYVVAGADGHGVVVSLWRPRLGRHPALELLRRVGVAVRNAIVTPVDGVRGLEPS